MARAKVRSKRASRSGEAPVSPGGAERADARWSPRSPVFIGLAAVAMAVPLAVDGRASGPYDDPKAWALPILVVATALARLARPPERPLPGISSDDRPVLILRWALLLSLAWWLITSAASLAPVQSVVGSFGRGMGLLTVSSAVVLYFLVRSECRTPDAARALIDAALLGSAPVCLLALGQAVGWDPLPPSWDRAVATLKVRSTFGQHIFLASYLALLVPLAAARLDWAWRGWRASGPEGARLPLRALLTGALWIGGVPVLVALASRWPHAWWALVPWGVTGAIAWAWARGREPGAARSRGGLDVALVGTLLLAQVLVIVLSAARGPLLGMILGLSAAGLTWLARRRARTALVVSLATVGTLLVALVLLNVPGSPLAGLTRVAVIQRLSQLADVQRGTPVWFRLEVWKGIVSGWASQMRADPAIPETTPRVRSAIGYGLESQLLALPRIGTFARDGWREPYVVDRAHNALLDHLVTTGLIGVGLWLTSLGALFVVGVKRVRSAAAGDELSMRLGCLGAVLAHLAEGQVGIVTAMPLALLWMVAGLLTMGPWSADTSRPLAARSGGAAPRPLAARSRGGTGARESSEAWSERRWVRVLSVGALALVGLAVVGIGTRWLLASTAYADGVRRHLAGQPAEAAASFRRSRELMPWLSLPAEAFAYTELVLAARESSPDRRLQRLHEAEAALAEARRHSLGGATSWVFTAQIALAEARAGERSKLPVSVEAFGKVAALRPQDPLIMAQLGLAWIESGDPVRARAAAQRALSLPGGRDQWLAWAVLSRAARDLGEAALSAKAAEQAGRLTPPTGAGHAPEFPSGRRVP